MDPRQKIAMAGLSLIGVIALTLGFIQFKRNLKYPFIGFEPIGTEEAQRRLSRLIINSEGDILALKNKDTDQDGLSDYDEVYVYKTSPYLPDSDSDGYSDKVEIESGNSPTCPAGKVCEKEVFPGANINPIINTNTNIFSGASPFGGLTNVSTETLRQYLKQAGITDEMLSSIDDATLRQLYEEALSGKTSSNPLSGINFSGSLQESIGNIPVSQIREYLKSNGLPASFVDSFDDETLKKMFMEAGQKK